MCTELAWVAVTWSEVRVDEGRALRGNEIRMRKKKADDGPIVVRRLTSIGISRRIDSP